MALETVVGEDTAQVGVALEEDTEHIVDLTLVPVSGLEKAGSRGHSAELASVGLHADSGVEADAEHVVYNLESVFTAGEVGSSDVHERTELRTGVVAEESEHRNECRGSNVDGELILPYSELLDKLGHHTDNVTAVLVEISHSLFVLVGWVLQGDARSNGLDTRKITKLHEVLGSILNRQASRNGAEPPDSGRAQGGCNPLHNMKIVIGESLPSPLLTKAAAPQR